ncbi:MAG: ubiquinol-cytochrome C chaperone family protein [Rhodospirillaceae bacterium]|nr:ubiquinol-cytochrome C chaperone family protein [Rhodospirillaceae bacterium]
MAGYERPAAMSLFSWLQRADPDRESAPLVYEAIVAAARRPELYAELGVPDSVDGRFDLIVLHAMLVIRRLRREGPAGARLSQVVFDYMFSDFDRSLREIGVGDMSIGKHVKRMAKAFYGRAEEYERGLDGLDADLRAALQANLYRATAVSDAAMAGMIERLHTADKALAGVTFDEIKAGRLRWEADEASSP